MSGTDRIASCEGKSRFPNPATARAVLDRMGKPSRRRRTKRAMEVYRCRHCGGWHIGGRSSMAFRDLPGWPDFPPVPAPAPGWRWKAAAIWGAGLVGRIWFWIVLAFVLAQ